MKSHNKSQRKIHASLLKSVILSVFIGVKWKSIVTYGYQNWSLISRLAMVRYSIPNIENVRTWGEQWKEKARKRERTLVGLRLAQFFNNACGKYRLSIFSFSCHSNQQRVFPFVVSRFDAARRFSYPPCVGPIVSNRTKRKETNGAGGKKQGRKKGRKRGCIKWASNYNIRQSFVITERRSFIVSVYQDPVENTGDSWNNEFLAWRFFFNVSLFSLTSVPDTMLEIHFSYNRTYQLSGSIWKCLQRMILESSIRTFTNLN